MGRRRGFRPTVSFSTRAAQLALLLRAPTGGATLSPSPSQPSSRNLRRNDRHENAGLLTALGPRLHRITTLDPSALVHNLEHPPLLPPSFTHPPCASPVTKSPPSDRSITAIVEPCLCSSPVHGVGLRILGNPPRTRAGLRVARGGTTAPEFPRRCDSASANPLRVVVSAVSTTVLGEFSFPCFA